MYNCECLLHPFQNDPGTSQSQRVMDELLSGAAKIDGRTLADLLDYFVQLSRHINYYDSQLNVSDWQLFFKNSIPFTLACSEIRAGSITNRSFLVQFPLCKKAFSYRLTVAGLFYFLSLYQQNKQLVFGCKR